jgi:hypothetical protein
MSDGENYPEWVSAGCTLPTSEQPLRVAEFDDLFRAALRAVDRPEHARLALAFAEGPGVEARLRDLIAREAQCCSFFTFAVTRRNGGLRVEVAVPSTHLDVLDEIAARARRVAGLET